MSYDFVAVEGDCWLAAGILGGSTIGMELTRIRTATNFANAGFNSESPVFASRTAGQAIWRMNNNSAWQINTTNFFWRSSGGVEVVRIRNTAAGVQQLQYWNGSAFVGVGATQTPVLDRIFRARLVFSGLGTAAGSLTLTYTNVANGIIEHTWTASGLDLNSCPNIARVGVNKSTTGAFVVGEYVFSGVVDLDATVVHEGVGTGAGTDNVNAVGTFLSIDEGSGVTSSTDDSDFVQIGAVGDRYSMVMPARSFGGKAVKSIVINYRAQRGVTGATSVRPYLKISGTRYYAATQALTTSFVSAYQAFFNLNPATAAAWTAAVAEGAALEFGFEAAA